MKKQSRMTFIIIILLILAVIGLAIWKWPFQGYLSADMKEKAGFTEIGELQELDFKILPYIDSAILVIISVVVIIVYICYNPKKFTPIFLIVWFLLMFYASMKSFRFVYFAILPYSIMAAFTWKTAIVWCQNKSKYCLITIIFLFFVLVLSHDYTSNRNFFIDDSIYSLNDLTLPDNAGMLNHWQSGYMIRSFTGKEVRFEGSPNVNNLFIEALMLQNESEAYYRLNSLISPGQTPIIILTDKDLKAIDNWYAIKPDSLLMKLMIDDSEQFKLIYEKKTTYNWVMVWGER